MTKITKAQITHFLQTSQEIAIESGCDPFDWAPPFDSPATEFGGQEAFDIMQRALMDSCLVTAQADFTDSIRAGMDWVPKSQMFDPHLFLHFLHKKFDVQIL